MSYLVATSLFSLVFIGSAAAAPLGHVTGVGGVFVVSKDPKALGVWYHDVLGLELAPWGGALLRSDQPGHPPLLVWNPMAEGGRYIAPSTRDFMLDLAVDDLDAIVARLEARGVAILKRDEDANGRFVWILDPDGTKLELWQPKPH